MARTPQVVFVHQHSPMALGTPDQVLRATSVEALLRLPAQVEEALNGGYQFACGLLPYDIGIGGCAIQTSAAPVLVYLYRDGPAPYSAEPGRHFRLTAPFQPEQDQPCYHQAVMRILEWLAAGDCYQVNYAQRFRATWHGDPLAAFDRLLSAHPAPHACFFRTGDEAVFGVSPERFLSITGRQATAEPIKGSQPRGADHQEDRMLGGKLQTSAKDRAENLMIVDLLRNDLGRFCEPGSIRAAPLFELRRFSNVQHLVSTVTGTLRPDILPLAALLDAFPGGSVTGAPKRRAMQIIAELEPAPRGAYCGSFFWQDSQGRFDSNILIRTLQTDGDALYCHGGGGIVYDSHPQAEYEESWFKVRKLMEALDTRDLTPGYRAGWP